VARIGRQRTARVINLGLSKLGGLLRASECETVARAVGLGITSEEEWFNLPGIKPLTQLGLKGFVVPGWNGMMAPKGTPPAVLAKLSDALSAALSADAAVRAFNNMGFKPGTGTPGPMTSQIEADMRLFTAVIRERNLKFDT